MFSFLERKEPVPRDLERVIFDIAEFQREEDYRVLYGHMRARLVFLPVDPSTIPDEWDLDTNRIVMPTDGLGLRGVSGPNGTLLAFAATTSDNPALRANYVRVYWTDFLEMTLHLDSSFWGAMLQGVSSWVAFDRDRIRYILSGAWT